MHILPFFKRKGYLNEIGTIKLMILGSNSFDKRNATSVGLELTIFGLFAKRNSL